MYTADRNLYLDKDKKRVLEEGDPNVAWALVSKGGTLADSVAAHYGLSSTAQAKVAPAGPAKCPKCGHEFDASKASEKVEETHSGDGVDHSQEGKMGSTAAGALAKQEGGAAVVPGEKGFGTQSPSPAPLSPAATSEPAKINEPPK